MKKFIKGLLLVVLFNGYGQYSAAIKTGNIKCNELIESSGMGFSTEDSNVIWAHNDRDNKPKIFAINLDGSLVTSVVLDTSDENGFMSGDWEDMAVINKTLYIADVGDNPLNRKEHKILLLKEPKLSIKSNSIVEFKTYKFKFPKGYVSNNEAIAIDPISKKILVFSKKVKKRHYS